MDTLVKNKAKSVTELYNNPLFDYLRQKEFDRIDKAKQLYFDFTGGNLYPQSLLTKHFDYLKKHILGNPHSANPASQLSTNLIDETRKKVINFFNAGEYYCIFTANATSALQIIGECYPFGKESHFLLIADNHNSVNGIREYCKQKGGSFSYAPLHYESLTIDQQKLEQLLSEHSNCKNKLFAFPAQSNVSGIKHSLSLINKAHKYGWDVLLDAAAFAPTSKLNLSKIKPDFVTISFYKIFGYPTGLGCLLIKKTKFDLLQKPWFSGGTVSLVSVKHDAYFLLNNHERFENGTVNYLDIPAIKNGLEFIESIGIENINKRIKSITQYLLSSLNGLLHGNGCPIVKVFGDGDINNRGGNLLINLFDDHGSKFPYEYVQKKANDVKICIRTGCFCNPGIDEINNCITNNELEQYFTSRYHGDYLDMINFLGKLRGAIRISVGISTIQSDIDKLMQFLNSFKNVSISPSKDVKSQK